MKATYYDSYNRIINNYIRSIQYLRQEKLDFNLNINSEFRESEIEFFRWFETKFKEFSKAPSMVNDLVIRPDAIHFLIVNLHQLVFLPLFDEANESGKLDSKEIQNILDDIGDDFNLIVNSSIQLAISRDVKEISSHIVIEALNINWSNFKSSKVEIWG